MQAPYAAWRYEPKQLTPRLWLLHDFLDVDQQHCHRTRSDCVLHLRRSEPRRLASQRAEAPPSPLSHTRVRAGVGSAEHCGG